jgi:hypothetical protein
MVGWPGIKGMLPVLPQCVNLQTTSADNADTRPEDGRSVRHIIADNGVVALDSSRSSRRREEELIARPYKSFTWFSFIEKFRAVIRLVIAELSVQLAEICSITNCLMLRPSDVLVGTEKDPGTTQGLDGSLLVSTKFGSRILGALRRKDTQTQSSWMGADS